MKSFIAAAIMLAGSLSLAKTQGVRQYKIVNPQFASEHLPYPDQGTVTLDYTAKTVTLHATGLKSYPCSPGMACPTVMLPAKLDVTLPITSIEQDHCGVYQVTASVDKRPVDGALQVITVEDASKMTCKTLVKYVEKATYETASFNMMTGQESKAKSKMDLDTYVEMGREFKMAEGHLSEGFPTMEQAYAGRLTISKDTVTMDISIGLDCGNNLCPMYMPNPLQVTLPIVEKKNTGCSTDIVARATVSLPYNQKEAQEIVIRDYSNSVCEMVYTHPVLVEYKSDSLSQDDKVQYTKRASFSFDFAQLYMK